MEASEFLIIRNPMKTKQKQIKEFKLVAIDIAVEYGDICDYATG